MMIDKYFCLSSYLAFRFIWKEGIDFADGFQHKNFVPLNECKRIPVVTKLEDNLMRCIKNMIT